MRVRGDGKEEESEEDWLMKAGGMRQEVYSTATHIRMSDLWLQREAAVGQEQEWQQKFAYTFGYWCVYSVQRT